MKTRIIALILTVVMVLLALTSCSESYDIARDNLDTYAEFKLDDFLKALQNIEIEDETFTTNEETRKNIVAAKVYNAIVDKIIAASSTDDHMKSGELTAGDVLYFVYYAVDAEGNEFFGSHMKPSLVTSKDEAAKHVIRLDDDFSAKGEELLKAIADAVAKELENGKINLEDYVFSSLTATELKDKAVEELLEKDPMANEAAKTAAKNAAIKLANGDTVYISYSRTYSSKTEGGDPTTVTEVATYTKTVLDKENDKFHEKLFGEDVTFNVGEKVVFGKDADGKDVTTVDIEIDGVKYTYKDILVTEKVVKEGKAITFDYTPYPNDEKKEESPYNLHTSASKVNIGKKALTYYVYPVYAIDAPVYEDITAADILYHINGSKLTKDSHKVLGKEGYKNGDETLENLLKDVTLIFSSTTTDNKFYKDGSDLKKALDEYDAAVKAGGAKPTTEQKTVIDEKSAALTDAKNAALKDVIAKIVACKNADGKVLGETLLKNYVDNIYYTEKVAYDTAIQEKIDKEVLDLIYESVTIKKYPTDLLNEFKEHVREVREYEFYTELTEDKKTSNFEKYGSFENYLNNYYKDGVDAGIDKEAKEMLDPILKIFIVSQKLEPKAKEAMGKFLAEDIAAGLYRVDGEDDADANKEREEEADKFIIDNAYMKDFKDNLSASAYDNYIKTYGELNIRTAFQFQKLFAYLTSVEHVENKDMEATYVKYNEEGTLAFRVLSYKIVVETKEDAKEENTDK